MVVSYKGNLEWQPQFFFHLEFLYDRTEILFLLWN